MFPGFLGARPGLMRFSGVRCFLRGIQVPKGFLGISGALSGSSDFCGFLNHPRAVCSSARLCEDLWGSLRLSVALWGSVRISEVLWGLLVLSGALCSLGAL